MQTTNISWATYSWNPSTGCSHAGPECTNCYAEKFSRRQGRTSAPWTAENADENVTEHPERLDEPLTYHYPEGPGRIFVGSMTDLFHPQIDDEYIRQVVAVARQIPENVFIFLTKRPHRAAELNLDFPPNAWVGTSVGSGPGGEYPDTTHRIDQLRDVEAATRWVSAEPLIEPLGDVDLSGIDWLVVGGESAPDEGRREMDHAWARELLERARKHDVAYYFKQSSGRKPETGTELTVYNDEWGVYEQRRIREYPELPDITERARRDQEVTLEA